MFLNHIPTFALSQNLETCLLIHYLANGIFPVFAIQVNFLNISGFNLYSRNFGLFNVIYNLKDIILKGGIG